MYYTKYNVVNLTAKILLRFQLAGIFYIFSTVLFEVLTDPLTDPLTALGTTNIQHRVEENNVVLVLNSRGPYDPPYGPSPVRVEK